MLDEQINKFILDKYRIENIICNGSCGKVYLATHLETNRVVVVKIIKKIKNKTENKIKRDTEIPRLLDHINIIKIENYIDSELYAYLIYPYICNSICLSKIKKKELYFRNNKAMLAYIVEMMCQICNAIEYMHSKCVIHRDIKPHNIIISEHIALLIDFDLAFIMDSLDYPLRKGIIGTPNYLAPEIWKDSSNINYPLTDIYSFGVTLYFIFNKKKLPYDADTIESLDEQIRYHNPIPSNSGFPDIDKLIMSTISKNPNNRPTIKKIRKNLKKII